MNMLNLSARMDAASNRAGGPAKLAERAGLSPSVIRKYQRGESDPSRERLVAIAEAAGVNLLWLATGEGPMLTASARLDEIEAKIDGLSGEERRGAVEDLESIARARDVPNSQRNRASIMLDFLREQDEYGDSEESEESEMRPMSPEATARTDAVAARIAQGAAAYDRAVQDVGYTPPEMTGIMLRDALSLGELTERRLREILKAMKYDAGA